MNYLHFHQLSTSYAEFLPVYVYNSILCPSLKISVHVNRSKNNDSPQYMKFSSEEATNLCDDSWEIPNTFVIFVTIRSLIPLDTKMAEILNYSVPLLMVGNFTYYGKFHSSLNTLYTIAYSLHN